MKARTANKSGCTLTGPRQRILLLVVLLWASWVGFLAAADPAAEIRAAPLARTLDSAAPPLAFIPNIGQFDPAIQFQAQSSGSTLFFTAAAVGLVLPPEAVRAEPATARVLQREAYPTGPAAVLKLRFAGATATGPIVAEDPLPGIVNYLPSNQPATWHTSIPTYGTIVYQQLYPGIDLRYTGNVGTLKGTYIVAPAANPAAIRWHYEGAQQAHIDPVRGDLVITLPPTVDGAMPNQIVEHAPVAWQDIAGDRRPVDIRYQLFGATTIGFALDAYDPAYPLVIDPALDYSSYHGGGGGENALAVAVDGEGAMYLAGWTRSADFPLAQTLPYTWQDTQNAFVSKFAADGQTLLYSTYLGGSSDDTIRGIVVDAQGHAIVTGVTKSRDFPTVNPLQASFRGGARDAFIAKLNPTGDALLYSTYLGGSADDMGNDIVYDTSSGAVSVIGHTFSTDFPTVAPLQPHHAGGSDVFVTTLTTDGSPPQTSTYLGGNQDEEGWGIALDPRGVLYLSGLAASKDFPIFNAVQETHQGGGVDIFVAALNPDRRSFHYSTYLGGSQEENQDSGGLAVNAQGEVWVTGWTNSTDFPTANAHQATHAGGWDVFLTKLRPDGRALLASTYLGSSGDEGAYSLALDTVGNAAITGWTTADDFPLFNAFQPVMGGGELDTFISKFSADGSQLWYSTYLGGEADDVAWAITIDRAGNTYVAGQTWSTRFPTVQPLQAGNMGSRDAFVAKIGILALTRTASAPFQADVPTRYTLTLTNTGSITLTDLVLTHPLPPDARYERGGEQIGDTLQWNIDRLIAGSTVQVEFELASAQPLTTTAYHVRAAGGYVTAATAPQWSPQPAVGAPTDARFARIDAEQPDYRLLVGIVLMGMVLTLISWRLIQQNRRPAPPEEIGVANPYIAGGPIDRPEMFFGREKLMQDVLQGLLYNHIAVEGPRRMGKTSLLIQLARRLQRSEDTRICFIPVYADCQRITEGQFFFRVMRIIVETITGRFPLLDVGHLIYQSRTGNYDDSDFEDDLQDMLASVRVFEHREIRIILLVDEGDLINEYSVQMQGKIRGLLSDNKVLKMVWTGVNIVRVSRSVDSPWFNMLVTYALPPLHAPEARRLIVEPASRSGYRYEPAAIQQIVTATAGRPYHIQALCYRAIEHVRADQRRTIEAADIEHAIGDLSAQVFLSEEYAEVAAPVQTQNGSDTRLKKE